MRFLAIAIMLVAICSVSIDASPATERRFIGSIGNWINDNIIKPVEQAVINPVVDAVNTVVNVVNDNVIQPVIDGVNDNIIKPVQELINGPNVPQPAQQNLCAENCLKRFNGPNGILDFVLNQPNGCRAKGFVNGDASFFDSCCDKHSACLNNQCCTTDCGDKKTACDVEFRKCARDTCEPLYDDYEKWRVCDQTGGIVVRQALAYKCNAESTVNRKVCYCHI